MKFLSRKFLIALAFTLTACIAFLFYDNKLTGAEFVSFGLGILTLFGGADVALNAIHKRNSETPNDPA